jgi:hypothetical protein
MTRAKWSMMIGAVVVASGVFAGMAFAADGGPKADPSAAHGVTEKQALMDQAAATGKTFSVELSKAGLSSAEQLQAELDQRVADGLITREQADILFSKVSAERGW